MQGFSFWLLPDNTQLAPFSALSEQCQQQMDACALPLHITLYVGQLGSLTIEQVAARGAQFARSLHPLELSAYAIQLNAAFNKSAYLRFHNDPLLIAFYQRCSDCFSDDYPFDPHMSLYYKHGEMAAKRQQASQLAIPEQALRFDRLYLTRHPAAIRDEHDIAAFTVVARWSLTHCPPEGPAQQPEA